MAGEGGGRGCQLWSARSRGFLKGSERPEAGCLGELKTVWVGPVQ